MTKAETLKLIKNELVDGLERYKLVSEWVLSEYGRYTKEVGYPYLKQVEEWIIKEHGLGLSNEEAERLNTLIYNASNVSRERQDRADGWITPSNEWLKERVGRQVILRSESILGNSAVPVKIVEANGCFYYMKPGARTRGIVAGYNKVKEAV